MLSLGPLPITAVLVLLGFAASAGVAWTLERSGPPERVKPLLSPLLDVLLVGLVGARLGFVLRAWPDYAAEPAAILMIGDGGYWLPAGIVAAIGFGVWRTRREPVVRKPLALAAVVGLLAWVALGSGLRQWQRDTLPIPEVPLARFDGGAVQLPDFKGRPLVVNLWATWCPPCRREMPALIAAQAAHPDVQFVFVNQGEDADTIGRFLQASGHALAPVLLDRDQQVAARIQTRGLPTTLFYAADGRLAAAHMGPLTRASLSARLATLGGH